jgi:hypothetical protein
MVQLGFEKVPHEVARVGAASRCGPNHWTGLQKEARYVFPLGPRFSLETPHRPAGVWLRRRLLLTRYCAAWRSSSVQMVAAVSGSAHRDKVSSLARLLLRWK